MHLVTSTSHLSGASNIAIRYKLGIQYNGGHFRGWQSQPEGSFTSFPYSTVQQTLDKALEVIVGKKVNLVIAGRTDSGVHAIENIAHVDISREAKSPRHPIPEPLSASTLRLALNGALKQIPGVQITKVEIVNDTFHARFSATQRTYQYRIVCGTEGFSQPFDGYGRWYLRNRLNLDNMRLACSILQGHHDFSTFRVSSDPSTPIRTLREVRVTTEANQSEYFRFKTLPADLEPQYHNLTFTSQSFMTHQVRKMVATIVECGKGRLSPDDVKTILESKSPANCPRMAPPHGLFLTEIQYPQHDIYDSTDPLATIVRAPQSEYQILL